MAAEAVAFGFLRKIKKNTDFFGARIQTTINANIIPDTNFHDQSDGLNTNLSNIEHHFLNIECTWTRTPYFCFEQASNIKPYRAFTRFAKLLIGLTRISFFQSSNKLKRVHILVFELEHPIFGFERSNIVLQTNNPSLKPAVGLGKTLFLFHSWILKKEMTHSCLNHFQTYCWIIDNSLRRIRCRKSQEQKLKYELLSGKTCFMAANSVRLSPKGFMSC